MGYVDKILQPDERIVYKAPIHLAVYLRALFVFLLACVVLGWALLHPVEANGNILRYSALGIGALLLLVSLYAFFDALIERSCTELVITSRRVVAKVGFIQRRTWEINAAKVEGVEVFQSILGRILDYGTVTVKGTGGGTAPIRNVDDPVAFRAQVTSL